MPPKGTYRLYVPYPAGSQILRYEPTADGSGFSAPVPYFLDSNEPVATFKQIMVDGDLYAVTPSAPAQVLQRQPARASRSIRHPTTRTCARATATACSSATGAKGSGQLFIWDSQWQRILVYNKTDGTYVAQYLAAPGAPPFADITGMYVIDRGVTQPPILVWSRPDGLYQVPLAAARSAERITRRIGPDSFPPSTVPPVTVPPVPVNRQGRWSQAGRCRRALSRPNGRGERRRARRAHRPRSAPDRE